MELVPSNYMVELNRSAVGTSFVIPLGPSPSHFSIS
jgi:hypothetical protein